MVGEVTDSQYSSHGRSVTVCGIAANMRNDSSVSIGPNGLWHYADGGNGHARTHTTSGDYSIRRPTEAYCQPKAPRARASTAPNSTARRYQLTLHFYSTILTHLQHTYSELLLFRLGVQLNVPKCRELEVRRLQILRHELSLLHVLERRGADQGSHPCRRLEREPAVDLVDV